LGFGPDSGIESIAAVLLVSARGERVGGAYRGDDVVDCLAGYGKSNFSWDAAIVAIAITAGVDFG
jgi:hypothetical protein